MHKPPSRMNKTLKQAFHKKILLNKFNQLKYFKYWEQRNE